MTTVADGTLWRSCSVDSSSFARLKAVLAQFLLTASLQKNDSTKSKVIFVDKFARLFVVQQGNFCHAISSREKKLKLDGHTQETSAWASTQDTRDEPKSSTHNQGAAWWYHPMTSLPCSLACSLSLARSLSKTQGQYHTAQSTYIYLWTGFPSLRSLSLALTFRTLNSCSAALCHAASVKRL